MLLGGMNAKKRLVQHLVLGAAGHRPALRLSTGVIHNVDKSQACHYPLTPHIQLHAPDSSGA